MPELLYETREMAVAPAESVSVRALARTKIFLLSPANASGVKGQRLLAENSDSEFVQRLRGPGLPLGEVYRYISSLYFRGKLDYARQFKNPPREVAGVHVITGDGLMLPETVISQEDLRRISTIPIDERNSDYRQPLDRDLLRLKELIGIETDVILLGSVATQKYIAPLRQVFGRRVLFPKDFLGLGDMSRGGIMLRCCAARAELEYQCVEQIPRIQTQKQGKQQITAKKIRVNAG